MKRVVIAIAAAALVYLGGCAPQSALGSKVVLTGPQVPITQPCPNPGLRFSTILPNRRVATSRSLPSDPSDPDVCVTRNIGEGRTYRSLLGLVSLPLLAGEEDARRAMKAVMSGSSSEECFESKESPSIGMGYIYARQCWKQIGQTTISLNGKDVPVIAIGQRYEELSGNFWAGDTVNYLDPSEHVIVRFVSYPRSGRDGLSWTRSIVR